MSKWEVCRIERDQTNKSKNKFLVVLDTTAGRKVIAQSNEFHYDQFYTKGLELHSQLVGRLLADGWEPLSTDQYGHVSVFRRQAP